MLYVVASIAFMFFCIRLILLWTALWQESEYTFYQLKKNIHKILKIPSIHGFLILLCIMLLPLYIVTIFFDQVALWYQLFVAIVFILEAILFLSEIRKGKVIKPLFGMKALCISLLATFSISFLYTIPLVDMYVWLVILIICTPFIVSIFVVIFAFPSEIYEDYIVQNARKKLKNNKNIFTIAICGYQRNTVKAYIQKIVDNCPSIIIAPRTHKIGDITNILSKELKSESSVVVYDIRVEKKDETQKILQLLPPQLLIITEGIGEEKEVTKMYRYVLDVLPKNSQVVASLKNNALMANMRYKKKNISFYGMQNSSKKGKISIFGYNKKFRGNKITYIVHLGKEEFPVAIHMRNLEEPILLLPAVFICRKIGIPIKKIQKAITSI